MVDRLLYPAVRWDKLFLEHEEALDHGRDARNSLPMANIGFDRANMQGFGARSFAGHGSECVCNRCHFSAVPSLGSCAVHFHVTDVVWVNPCLIHDFVEERLLCGRVWMGNGDGVGGMIGHRLHDQTQNAVVVSLSVFQSLNDQRSDAVATAVAIGVVVIGLAVASLG